MPITIVTGGRHDRDRPAPAPKSGITIIKRDERDGKRDVFCVIVSNLSSDIQGVNLRQIFSDYSNDINGVKRLADGCFMMFMQDRATACSLAAKYNAAEVEGQKIYCYAVQKLIAERQFEVKLRR